MTPKGFFDALKELPDTKCQVKYTGEFKRNLKLAYRRLLNLELMLNVVHKLAKHENLDVKFKPHVLTGNYAGIWICHISPDWALLWNLENDILTLVLVANETHTDLVLTS